MHGNAEVMVTPPLCVNCAFYVFEKVPEGPAGKNLCDRQTCRHPHACAVIEPVLGAPVDCADARRCARACGEAGRLFEGLGVPNDGLVQQAGVVVDGGALNVGGQQHGVGLGVAVAEQVVDVAAGAQ